MSTGVGFGQGACPCSCPPGSDSTASYGTTFASPRTKHPLELLI